MSLPKMDYWLYFFFFKLTNKKRSEEAEQWRRRKLSFIDENGLSVTPSSQNKHFGAVNPRVVFYWKRKYQTNTVGSQTCEPEHSLAAHSKTQHTSQHGTNHLLQGRLPPPHYSLGLLQNRNRIWISKSRCTRFVHISSKFV